MNIADITLIQWALAFLAVFVLGLAKGGIKGVGVIMVTLLALAFGSKDSTGIMLPLLSLGDIFAVIYYNRHAKWNYIFRLLPWIVIGVLFGVWVGKDLPEELFKRGMAIIILGTVAMMFWWERQDTKKIPKHWGFAGIMGLSAGFTTMIGNLAGAFTSIFFLAMRLPKNEFIGTAAWLYFITNLFKLPFHIFVWETVSWETLTINLYLMPAVFAGLFVGIRFVAIIKEQQYRKMILLLTALGALLIFFR